MFNKVIITGSINEILINTTKDNFVDTINILKDKYGVSLTALAKITGIGYGQLRIMQYENGWKGVVAKEKLEQGIKTLQKHFLNCEVR